MTVPREETQAKLDRLAAGALRHTPDQAYTVADRFEERAARHPDRPFLFFGDRTLSYSDLNTAANRVAHVAVEAGFRSGEVVALWMENRPEFVATWAGFAKLGVTVALLNTNLRGPLLQCALDTTGARALLAGAECLTHLADTTVRERGKLPLYVLSDPAAGSSSPLLPEGSILLDPLLAQAPVDNPDPALRARVVGANDLFYIFTSGTTGLPKAARLSHTRFLGTGDGMSAVAGYRPDDVIACVLPLYHGAGGMVVVSCALSAGGTIALRRRFSASRFWDDARRYRVTAFQYIGEICRYLLNRPPSPRDREHDIRVMMGAGLSADVWRGFQERFGIERVLEGWSSTEANTSLINLDNRIGSCGRIPFKERHNGRLIRYNIETEEHPRDANGFCIECTPGETGEFIGMIPDLPNSAAGRFEGYTSAEETVRKILRNVFCRGDRWYRSGDLLRCDEDGYFYFVDRIGDTFRWKSENVSTQEVAEVLARFPGVASANVYGVRVPAAEGRAGMAALVLTEEADFDGVAFYAFTEKTLPPYAAPQFVRLVGSPDITTTFKLRKIDLQRQGYDTRLVRDPLFARDDEMRTYQRLPAESDNSRQTD